MKPDDIVHLLKHGWIHYDNPLFAIIPITTLEQAAKVIEALRKEIYEGLEDLMKSYVTCPIETLSPSGIELRNKILGWTPCSEKMPEEEENVLVTRYYTLPGFSEEKYWYVEQAEWDGEMWFSYADDHKVGKHSEPIAWAPMPEPYHEL